MSMAVTQAGPATPCFWGESHWLSPEELGPRRVSVCHPRLTVHLLWEEYRRQLASGKWSTVLKTR